VNYFTSFAPHFLGAQISVGDHEQVQFLGLTLNLDTIWATAVAMAIVIGVGLYVRSNATSGVPGKMQLIWETVVSAVRQQVDGSIGPRGQAVVPLAVTLFFFILTVNWFSFLGTGATIEAISPASGDINFTAALALIVIIPVHVASVRVRGFGGYLSHYSSQPFPKILFPFNIFINLVEELAKPITLALRLFGNLLSGGLMLALIAALGVWTIGSLHIGYFAILVLNPVWKLFDLFIGAIQAFIFALLTILYFDTAMSEAH
jgi:F-type H+-transporting ATPase subunit a